jgi:hypothetical protein
MTYVSAKDVEQLTMRSGIVARFVAPGIATEGRFGLFEFAKWTEPARNPVGPDLSRHSMSAIGRPHRDATAASLATGAAMTRGNQTRHRLLSNRALSCAKDRAAGLGPDPAIASRC